MWFYHHVICTTHHQFLFGGMNHQTWGGLLSFCPHTWDWLGFEWDWNGDEFTGVTSHRRGWFCQTKFGIIMGCMGFNGTWNIWKLYSHFTTKTSGFDAQRNIFSICSQTRTEKNPIRDGYRLSTKTNGWSSCKEKLLNNGRWLENLSRHYWTVSVDTIWIQLSTIVDYAI